MNNRDALLYWDTFQKTRDLTKYYISLMKAADPYLEFELSGKKLNSFCWIVCHLTWAQDFLMIRATGGKGAELSWLEHYQLGADGSLHEPKPDFKQVLHDLKAVHELAHAHVISLDDEALEKTNTFGFAFGTDSTNRMMLQHAIRHEGTHVGHLGWLVKLNGGKAV